jgi:uncharacterized protein YacL
MERAQLNKSIADLPLLEQPNILLDTSAIIDGRIAEVAAAGFVPGRLLVPRFVLLELQYIADSNDTMRRSRGQRGLDTLKDLRATQGAMIAVVQDDVPGDDVDSKLVILAQLHNCSVMTTDYNLNRVAQIQDVQVLNVNKLAEAMRPIVLPGETLNVKITAEGKEANQGVGYLNDGTMIVVDNGRTALGREIITQVTRVLQTVSGKMIFTVYKPEAV